MIRELYFPTPVYILDINDMSINKQLEKGEFIIQYNQLSLI